MRKMKFTTEFRSTNMGARDESLVFSERGELISPASRSRSRSGHHGEDIYVLPAGETYYVVSLTKSNSGHWNVVVKKITGGTEEVLFTIDDQYTWGGAITDEVKTYLELTASREWVGARYIQDVLSALPSLEVTPR